MLRKRIFKAFLSPLLIFAIFGALPCGGLSARENKNYLPAAVRKLVQEAVFEVVIEKKDGDKTKYEKELNWEAVPYAIRSDKYYSIGTAFAVSPTELATAFHVINLGNESKVYTKYFIRDSSGAVFEVGEINAGSSERDFLIFTAEGRVFSSYFKLKGSFDINQPVFSIGNALGEGIVLRNGLVLGTVPESESGRWNLLKSSADGNPGNSGGPLVTTRGEVIGLVTSLRDNILYSTPASELLKYKRTSFSYRVKPSYSHLLLTNSITKTFEAEIPLPAHYKAVQKEIVELYKKQYVEAMHELFAAAPEYLNGPANAYLLNSTTSSIFPQIDFVDRNDNNWKLSRLDIKSTNFADDGRLYYSSVSGFNFFKIRRPKSDSEAKLDSDPKAIMDTILANWRTDRTLTRNEKYRILSFGAPDETGVYKDSVGRVWIRAFWLIPFDDRVLLMYVLPQPGGPSVITTMQSSSEQFVYQWDIEKTCDHVHAAYSASFKEWDDFLALENYRPDFLSKLKFDWSKEAGFNLSMPDASFGSNNNVFEWTDASELFMLPAYHAIRGKVDFGITKFILNRNQRRNDYFILVKNLKPDARLGPEYRDEWDDIVNEKFPYNDKAALSPKDNNGSIGSVINAKNIDDDVRWTLYMTLENPSEESLSEKFSILKNGIDIVR